ncbi:uncharacterized protein LOC111337170 [Stylophora pistillata]|uniref:UPAR/Ly6 domain-containing protein n=1 Tax=Stylophora pistillata TaxID=50429 RepID=A0A2B4RTS6_STYPI|nr:uncharacterized protein LOC111337170 [Stylophora pistillata]PFX20203.1 hypothetical protein AWC38_SpisGene15341 [Stylophora pistillata]
MYMYFVRCASFVLVLLTKVPCFSEALRCYACVSNISWEECDAKMELIDCPDGHDEVCIKEHQVRYKYHDGDEQVELFSRTCGTADLCTKKHCEKFGIRCDPNCCHEDLCNRASAELSTQTMLVTRLVFATLIALFLS